MDDAHRVRVVGPLEPYAAGFAAELTRLGYTVFSARLQAAAGRALEPLAGR